MVPWSVVITPARALLLLSTPCNWNDNAAIAGKSTNNPLNYSSYRLFLPHEYIAFALAAAIYAVLHNSGNTGILLPVFL